MKIAIVVLCCVIFLALIWVGVFIYLHPMRFFNAVNRRALKTGGLTRAVVATSAGNQVVWEGGSGPTLVFLHGAGDHAGSWAKVAPGLTARYHVLALDLAGHGESDPTAGPLALRTILSGVDGVLSQKAAGQRVTIVGNSLGAWMATLYAQAHPDQVERLVLVNGGAIKGVRPDLAFIPHNRTEAATIFANILDPGTAMPADFVLDDVVREASSGPLSRLAAAVADWDTFLIQDANLSQLRTPTDLLWGESDRMFGLDYAQRLLNGLPASRLTVVPHCGHIPQQECSVEFATKLSDVLSQPAPVPKPSPVAASQAK